MTLFMNGVVAVEVSVTLHDFLFISEQLTLLLITLNWHYYYRYHHHKLCGLELKVFLYQFAIQNY
jgi:hypothetical protein